MSRIGKKPVSIPTGVEVKLSGSMIIVKGPKGTLQFSHRREVKVAVEENTAVVTKVGETKKAQAIWGTTTKLIANMIAGVTLGFQKQLELNGVGFRMVVAGKKLNMALGFSHPVEFPLPAGVQVTVDKNIITLESTNKELLGETAANIRKIKKPEHENRNCKND